MALRQRIQPLTVSQVSRQITNVLTQDIVLRDVWIEGELTEFKRASSGHLYFSVQDEKAALRCAMWRGVALSKLDFAPQNGQKVILHGHIDWYAKSGSASIIVDFMQPAGLGALAEKLRLLNEELEKEGLYDERYKQPIPVFAQRIGIVTSATGQAVRDIESTARKRNPYVQLVLAPALVQGDAAAASIAAGIRRLDALNLDVIIVGRGGGSDQDLYAFNEEPVARAIFECRTPIISAVGHTGNVSIADSVADKKAITPTEAAVLAVTPLDDFDRLMQDYQNQMTLRVAQLANDLKKDLMLRNMKLQTVSPLRIADSYRRRLAPVPQKLLAAMNLVLGCAKEDLDRARTALDETMDHELMQAKTSLAAKSSFLEAHSPLHVLAGGYAYAEAETKEERPFRVSSVMQLEAGDALRLYFKDGRADARVTGIQKDVFKSADSGDTTGDSGAESTKSD